MFTSIEAFHDGLRETEKMVVVDLDFLKPDWYVVFKMFLKTFFDDPFEKFHNCTK